MSRSATKTTSTAAAVTRAAYAQFYKAIKAKYPKLQIIATTPVKRMQPDVIDDHYYKRARRVL